MTDKQIENWREVLLGILGPYALIMPREKIEKQRDIMQEWANKEGKRLSDLEGSPEQEESEVHSSKPKKSKDM